MDFDFDDFSLDITDMGLALGLGDELAQGVLEQAETEREFRNIVEKERDGDPEITSLSNRHTASGTDKNHGGYYDPFMHYADEVSNGIRYQGDLTGIDFAEGLDAGPDENGNY